MPPPDALIRSLLDGPSPVASFEWHDEIDSTNRRALELAGAGAPEIAVVAADLQTAGRGRAGRTWTAPAGSSLMLSLVVRPPVPATALPLLPLLTGLVLAEVVERTLPGAQVGLKWPNDVLVGPPARAGGAAGMEGAAEAVGTAGAAGTAGAVGAAGATGAPSAARGADGLTAEGDPLRKTAGILVEATTGAAVIGMGTNVDWRGVDRPADLSGATSLAEVASHREVAAEGGVDRWRLLAALLGVFGNRYAAWCDLPGAFLDGYRARCTTIGREITAVRPGGPPLEGVAVDVAPTGALVVRGPDGRTVEVSAGDVTHVRPR